MNEAGWNQVKEAVHDIDGKHFPVGRAEPRPAERNSWHHEDTKSMGGPDKGHTWPSRYSRALSPRGGLFPGTHGMARLGLGSPYALDRMPLEAARLGEIASYASRAPFSFPEEYEINGGLGNAGGFHLSKATANSTRVFVGGLPDTLVERHIRAHFQRFGLVEDVYFPRERKTGRRRGFCFVRFDSARAAHTAAAQTSRVIMGHEVGEIKIANERPEEPGNDKSSEFGLDKSISGPDGDFGAGLGNGQDRGLGSDSTFGPDRSFGPGGRGFLPDRSFGPERGFVAERGFGPDRGFGAERGFGLDRGFWPDRSLGPDRGGLGQDRGFRTERLFGPDRGFGSDRDFAPERGPLLEKSFGIDRSFGPDRSFGSERGHSLDRLLTDDMSNGQDLYGLERRYASDRGYDRDIAPAFEREYSSDRTHGLESSTSNNKMGPPYSDLARALPREFALDLARDIPNEFARAFQKDFESDYSTNLRSEYPRDIPQTFDNRFSIRSEHRFPVRYRPY